MQNNLNGKLITRDPTFTVDTGTTGLLDTASDSCVFDVEDLTNIELYLNQITDAGVDSLLVEKTVDGTNWATVTTKADTDFPAGANTAVAISLSDANGMPLHAKQLRVTLTAAGGGEFTAVAAGRQLNGFA